MSKEVYKLPRYEDLVRMDMAANQENELQVYLNQDPPKAWIKTNELANNSLYIPIDKIEYMLTRFFVNWYVQVMDWKVIANSVSVHVRLHYQNPFTREFMYQDGLGAAPMQTNKGAGATDFNQIKNSAVQMALPAAETYAIKDAAEKIGRIFGKDLNRRDLMNYSAMSGRFVDTEDLQTKVNECETIDELNRLSRNYPKTPEVIEIFTKKAATL